MYGKTMLTESLLNKNQYHVQTNTHVYTLCSSFPEFWRRNQAKLETGGTGDLY